MWPCAPEVCRIENDDCARRIASAWVFAHTTRTGDTSNRNATVPSWEFSAIRYRSTGSMPPISIVGGSFIDRNTDRPPRSDPAVSKCAPDSSTTESSRAACASFWIGV